jgi:hypothetical protein
MVHISVTLTKKNTTMFSSVSYMLLFSRK